MNSREKEQIRYRVYEILEVRSGPDPAARVYDFVYLITIILNLLSAFFIHMKNTGCGTAVCFLCWKILL